MDSPDATRINRFLAAAGVASRRAADTLVEAGRVRIDGVVAETGSQVRPGQKVTLDGNPGVRRAQGLSPANKPGGVVDDRERPRGPADRARPRQGAQRVFPVGRLDSGTTGLLLLTNDGALAERLMHPRYGVEKIYHALVKGLVPEEVAAQLSAGVELDDGPTLPASVKIVGRDAGGSVLEFILKEGRNRQIRRMCDAVGYHVRALRRTATARCGSAIWTRSLPQPHAERAVGAAAARWSRAGDGVRSRRPGSR